MVDHWKTPRPHVAAGKIDPLGGPQANTSPNSDLEPPAEH